MPGHSIVGSQRALLKRLGTRSKIIEALSNIFGPVSTFAGSTQGYLDATGTAAQFAYPGAVVSDSLGNLYVVDTNNRRIRKIDNAGVVTTFAGSGSSGNLDGTGTAAQFSPATGITLDSGNLYVTDYSNHRIRKIVISTGVVTTFAGSTQGYLDATGTAAQFSYPYGIIADSGNLYVTDELNHRIRKIVIATGVVTTFAGSGLASYLDGTGTAAQFNRPHGIVANNGNLYVTDSTNHRIRKIVISTAVVTTLAGSGSTGTSDGTGTAAQFYTPDGIIASSNNLYVCDFNNNRIRKIVISTAVVTTLTGSTPGYLDGALDAALFNHPYGITLNSNNFYVVDGFNHRIRKIEIPTIVTTFAGSGSASYLDGTGIAAQFRNPQAIVADSGNLYVADASNHKIRKIVISTGVVTTLAGSTQGAVDGTGTAAQFNTPVAITLDSGNLYVTDALSDRIRKVVISTGVVTTFAGTTYGYLDGTGTAAQFRVPQGIVADSGNLYVTDAGNHRIRKIVISTGVVTTFAGSTQGYLDATGTAAQFNNPTIITSDSGNLYVGDTNNRRIRKIVISTGVVTTFAGSGSIGTLDGTGTAAQFFNPNGITADSGNLYVSDNQRIRKIVISTADVTRFAGSGSQGYIDGKESDAQFNNPYGLIMDSGNLYVADGSNNRIRKITFI